jgi:hypothetical protein
MIRRLLRLIAAAIVIGATVLPPSGHAAGSSLRFFGNGANEIDRVTIRLDAPHRPVDVGAGDFTVEWWMKASLAENPSNAACNGGADDWITGNIILDRDVYGAGDNGDWGISLGGGRLIFGVSVGNSGATACGSTVVADGEWHHIAATRSAGAQAPRVRLWVDGQLDAEADGPVGDASYRNGRTSVYTYDPFLVIGAEKHDAGAAYPSYSGWIDELRISTVVRYTAAFAPPSGPFSDDANTAALYHLDEGAGDSTGDSAIASGGPSNGQRRFGGSPQGPVWSTDTPFSTIPRLSPPPRAIADPTPAARPTPRASTGGSGIPPTPRR